MKEIKPKDNYFRFRFDGTPEETARRLAQWCRVRSLEEATDSIMTTLSQTRLQTLEEVERALPEAREIYNQDEVGKSPTHATATNQHYGFNEALNEVKRDITEEEQDTIKVFLWREFGDELLRRSIGGLPEWYKDKLLGRAFESDVQDK